MTNQTRSESKTGMHGFSDWFSFIKATISLGSMLTLGLWAILTWAMDGRYLKTVDFSSFEKTFDAAVDDLKKTVTDSARHVQCEALLDDIARLEQTIAYKKRENEDTSLEGILLDAGKRRLAQYDGCKRSM